MVLLVKQMPVCCCQQDICNKQFIYMPFSALLVLPQVLLEAVHQHTAGECPICC